MKYKILNYWNNQNDLYINYIVENLKTGDKANVINYFNISDLDCDYNIASKKVVENSILKLIEQDNHYEFNLPKVSEISPLLKYVYDCVCASDANMCHIDYDDWEEIKEDYSFTEDDINNLNEEIKKYNLNDLIVIDDGEYKICGYGCLQTTFNDDRNKESDEFER